MADDAVVRWRPYKGRETIVVDPARAFGQPIAATAGIPTATLYDALRAEGSVKRVAYLYEVETPVIKDAEKFQLQLMAA